MFKDGSPNLYIHYIASGVVYILHTLKNTIEITHQSLLWLDLVKIVADLIIFIVSAHHFWAGGNRFENIASTKKKEPYPPIPPTTVVTAILKENVGALQSNSCSSLQPDYFKSKHINVFIIQWTFEIV